MYLHMQGNNAIGCPVLSRIPGTVSLRVVRLLSVIITKRHRLLAAIHDRFLDVWRYEVTNRHTSAIVEGVSEVGRVAATDPGFEEDCLIIKMFKALGLEDYSGSTIRQSLRLWWWLKHNGWNDLPPYSGRLPVQLSVARSAVMIPFHHQRVETLFKCLRG